MRAEEIIIKAKQLQEESNKDSTFSTVKQEPIVATKHKRKKSKKTH
jgi:hypothetical protein